ncbi:MAG: DUF393 domain-containing protein [Planctomycetaceae bacterium]|nr:MAG: DUF393 domain-containing protein [Planctomycetaceae bacterium]
MLTLPDPDRSPAADVVIYDGECRFCTGQVRNLRRLDIGGRRLSFLSLHDPRVSERYPDLSYDELMAQMYVVDGQGVRHGGSEAVRYLSRRLPALWPVMPILHLPGTAGLWRWAYRQVAARRYRIAGKSCDDGACSIHLGSPSAANRATDVPAGDQAK